MRKLLLFVVVSLFCIVSSASAGEFNYSLSPYLGYHFFGGERELKDRPEFGLKAERFLNDNLGLEVGLGYIKTKSEKSGEDANLLTYLADLKFYCKKYQQQIKPYVSAGLAGDLTRGMNIGPSVAVGAKYDIKQNMGIFAEIRDNYLFGDGNDIIATIGLNIYLDKKAKVIPKEEPKILDTDNDGVDDSKDKCPNTPANVKVDANGCPLDSDNDGVYDYLDKCPNTPANVKVDANGCPLDSDNDGVYDYLDKCPNTPANVKVDANGCPLDSDNDGVYDYLDKCPNTPANVKVDANGCPLDSDNDGVYDYLDKCPNSPAGSKVDATGCELSISLIIFFDTNKSFVKEQYYGEIEKVAKYMQQNPDIKVEIAGHTDNRGNRDANITLSQSRATAVADILINKFGVSKDRVSAKGYGPDKPVADNNTEEGRQKNRRVEAVIIK